MAAVDDANGLENDNMRSTAVASVSNAPSSETSAGDPMDLTMQSAAPSSTAVSTASGRRQQEAEKADRAPNGSQAPNAGAAATGQQPKVIQTAFIHKLYNMLEDPTISHLISWSNSDDSFLISPTAEFSRVLSTYFKHTNISSFVRQLNMYGFHKVSDVFQKEVPDTPLWEFKHGNGSFKKGDLAGLKEIKRRASRQTLSHRDTPYSTSHKAAQMPIAPASAEYTNDHSEIKTTSLERNFYEMHARLTRAEEANAAITETLAKCFQFNQDVTDLFLRLLPDPEHHVHQQAKFIQQELSRQMETLRSVESTGYPSSERRPSYVSTENGGPLSPLQYGQDDHRRPSQANTHRSTLFKQPFPSRSAAASPHRLGSISTRGVSPPPAPLPPAFVPPGQSQNHRQSAGDIGSPLYLSRRHTSADVRGNPGWQSAFNSSEHLPLPSINRSAHQSPYASAESSAHWPSSPRNGPHSTTEELQDTLGRYQIDSRNASTASNATVTESSHQQSQASQREASSRLPSMPLPPPQPQESSANHNYYHSNTIGHGSHDRSNSNWNISYSTNRIPFKDVFAGHSSSGPPTRRSSVAHLLNPAETAERDDEDDDLAPDDRGKRKRLG